MKYLVDEAPSARGKRGLCLRDRAFDIHAMQLGGRRGRVRDVRQVHHGVATLERGPHVMARRRKRGAQVAADEAALAGDVDAHGGRY